MTTEYTEHFRLSLPDFRMGPWHDLVNDDFVTIDDLLWNLFQGVDTTYWANGTSYKHGTTAIDPVDNSFWICMVDHTSAVSGTFAADRAAHPTYWNRVVTGIAPRGEWQNNTNYLPADLVCDSHEHIIAICKTAHTSNASGTIRDDAAYWTYLVDMGAITGSADQITYDNSTSGSPATQVQGALDDLYVKHDDQQGLLDTHTVEISAQGSQIAAQNAVITSNSSRIASLESLSGSFITDAPVDGNVYGRKDAAWYVVSGGGGGGVPGGGTGDIQFNNGGLFGGLTNVQVTARIQGFTDLLSGAVPASGGGTTKYLRADGSWAVPPAGTGDVVGPSGAVTARIAVFDGTTGKLIADSGALVSDFASVSHTHSFASLTAKPTTLAGYGITDTITNTFNGRSGAVMPANNDYSFASLSSKPTTLAGYGITDAQAALGYTPVNKAGDTMTGNLQIDRSATGAASLNLNGQNASSGGGFLRIQKAGADRWLEGSLSAIGGSTSEDYALYSIGLGGYIYFINYTTGNFTFNNQTTFEGQAVSPLQNLPPSAGISWDASLGQKAKVLMNAACGMSIVTNAVEGATYFLWLIQDGTGSRSMSWNTSNITGAWDFGAAGQPTLSTAANKADLLTFECISIAGVLKLRYTGIAKGFS